MFSGVVGAPAQQYPGGNPGNGITTLPTTPVSREKPFLYVDGSGNWNVFSPGLKTNSSGTSWSSGTLGAGTSLPISSFLIANPSTPLATINAALGNGQNLILTPGVYQYSGSINVTKANTVVLGLGYATLVPQTGTAALTVSDVDGVQVAGLIVDAGPVNSPVLLEVGTPGVANSAHASNPTSLNDVFFRIGGATVGSANTALQVDSGNVILDNIWSWRADHGNGGTTGWNVNTAAHGLVVNGNNVTALGLAVEHYQQSQVQWNGNGGETIFYQSELPYDVPSQSAWMDGTANGYPSYVVGSGVCTHAAYGLGIYSYFNQGVNIVEDNAMTTPNVTGVNVSDVGSVFLGGSGQITHVINGQGGSATSSNAGVLVPVTSFAGNGVCTTTAPSVPAAPSGLNAVNEPPQGSNTNPFVQLTWTASSTSGVTYTVYRSTGSGAAVAIQSGVTATTYADQTTAGSTTYSYYVVAANNAGNSAPSNTVTLTTGAAVVGAPTNLTATASGSSVNLGWTASPTSGVTYTVYRNVGTSTAGATILKSGLTSTTYTDSTVVSGTTYTYDVVAIANTSSGTSQSAQSNAATVTAGSGTTTPPANDVAAIDAGSASAVGSYSADTGFSGGGTYAPGQAVTVPSTLSNPAPAAVYQTARQGTFSYTIAGLSTTSSYTVRLHFAELYFSAAGQRVFNVAINGTTVLTNFDIVAAAGKSFTAVIEQFPNIQPNASGQIVISFSNGTVNQPMVNGIEVQAGTTTSSAATSIDAGGAAVGSFVADTDFTGGSTYAPGQTVTVPGNLPNAAPAAVYQTARQGGSFSYTVPGFAASSAHTVTLHFAELYFNAAQQREFNVSINGTPVMTNFDIYAAAGNKSFTAVVEQFANVAANSSGQYVITFSTGAVNQPMVSGLSIQ